MVLDWGNSYQKRENNNYYWYPSSQDEFKILAFQNSGISLRIIGDNIDIRYTGGVYKILKAPIGTRLRSMALKEYDNKKIREIFENCRIYAVPKSMENILKDINN